MVGQRTAAKPSRSDEVLDAEQQMRIADQVRAQFDSVAPKRPTKPNRSESDSTPPPPPLSGQNIPVPEFQKFQSLQSQSDQALFLGSDSAQDEFVETQYYKQLESIDKLHHTTGSGFIKVASEGDRVGYDLQLQNGHENGGHSERIFKTNPATNDWIPNVDYDQVVCVSAKPKRSESD